MINENRSKVAVIGCGFFATNHILSWSNFKDIDLVKYEKSNIKIFF